MLYSLSLLYFVDANEPTLDACKAEAISLLQLRGSGGHEQAMIRDPSSSLAQYQYADRVMMGELELQLFDEMISKGSSYFEYGMGGSTLFASEHSNLKHISAVDSSEEWVEIVRKEQPIVADIAGGRIRLDHVHVGKVGMYGKPMEPTVEKVRKYDSAIVGAEPAPDVVLVDGRYRVSCFLRTLLEAVNNDWPHLTIMIHDYERTRYQGTAVHFLGDPTHEQGSPTDGESGNSRFLAAWELSGPALRALSAAELEAALAQQEQNEDLSPGGPFTS